MAWVDKDVASVNLQRSSRSRMRYYVSKMPEMLAIVNERNQDTIMVVVDTWISYGRETCDSHLSNSDSQSKLHPCVALAQGC